MTRKPGKPGLGAVSHTEQSPTAPDVGSNSKSAGADALDAQLEKSLGVICSLVDRHTGHDFAHYKSDTLLRRIRHRMQLLHLDSVGEYARILGQSAGEAAALLKILLVGVTQFFRDPEAFQVLAREVAPAIVQSKTAGAPIRIWVPGCASGEEAYSLAILMSECLDQLGAACFVQIFATDLDPETLTEARRGRYPRDISGQVSPERLARFFVSDGQSYQAVKELRAMCVFSEHSLIRDPPFSRLDLISCRNVLIYFSSDLQKRLAPLFHYALRPGGFLLVGASEGVTGNPELFETMDKKNRIFRRKETVTRPVVEFPLTGHWPLRLAAASQASQPRHDALETAQQEVAATFERTLREEYTFPSAVINQRGDALFIAGPISSYLKLPVGRVAMPNLFEALRGRLRSELRAAMRIAEARRRKVTREPVPVEVEDSTRRVRLIVRPMPALGAQAKLFLVVVEECGAGSKPRKAAARDDAAEQPAMEQLENELSETRAELKSTVEDLESANEELQSSNQELVSTNEQLQSANEELQTSREELQSLNQELETVNTELRQKLDELAAANSDLQNLFAATQIATIFLDRTLRVVKFTPAATALFHLIATDVGRPLADMAPAFAGQDLVSEAREVLRVLTPVERQVRVAEGAWFVLRLRPYRTTENVVAGVLITFVDISEIKRAEESARQRAHLLHLSHDAVMVRRIDGVVEYWNRGAEELYGYSSEQAIGQTAHELLQTVFPKPFPEVEAELREGRWVGELQHRTRDGRVVTILSNMQLVRGDDGTDRILEANRDITERKAAERRLAYVASFPERNPGPIVEADYQGRVRYANPAAAELFPDLASQGTAHPWLADWRALAQRLQDETDGGDIVRTILVGDRSYEQSLYALADEGVIRTYGLDVTERIHAERTLHESEQRFSTAFLSGAAPMAIADAESHHLVEVNDAWVNTYGWSRQEALGHTALELGMVTSEEERRRLLEQAMQPEAGRPPEMRVRGKDGKPLDVIVRTATIEINGRPCLMSTTIDISERKRAEEALLDAHRRTTAILESVADAFFSLDDEWRFAQVNPAAAMAPFGRPESELLGKVIWDVFPVLVGTPTEQHYREVVESGVRQHYEAQSPLNGRWYEVFMAPRTGGLDAYLRDIDDRKKAEEALRAANQQLAEMDQRKNEFLAMLSHELRNPLTPIRNSLYVLDRATSGSEQAKRAQEVIDRQTEQLARLVDDLLDVTRISRGKIHLQRSRLDFNEVVRRTVEDHRSLFERNGVGLAMSLANGCLPVNGDKARLMQVVGNLLTNSAKFTPRGGQVSVSTALDASRARAVLRVIDDGSGIAPEMLPRLFEPFMQADVTLDRSKGGLGLGLALVKGFVEMHGGEVCARSDGTGKGAELVVELPVEPRAAVENSPTPVVAEHMGRRVLIVEDNVDAADSLREVLEFSGHVVEVAYNGPDGLTRARGFAPEVVLCDIGLPGMDGFEVARAFRADAALREVLLVALSGYALPEDLRRAHEAGFDRHLAKPPTLEKLDEVLKPL